MATTADDDDDYDDAAADDDDVDDDGTPEVLMIKTIVSVFLTINKRLSRFLTLNSTNTHLRLIATRFRNQ